MSNRERISSPEIESQSPDVAFGRYFPEKVLENSDIEGWGVRTQSGNVLTAEKILQTTGIRRRFVAVDEDQIDMGVKAAREAVRKRGDVSAYAVFGSSSYPVPGKNIASSIGDGLGIDYKAALTVHCACSGGPESLLLMHENREEFEGREMLIVASEKYSHTLADLRQNGIEIDPSLAQTIFSDGAYALQFEFGNDLDVLGGVRYEFGEEESQCLRMPVDESAMVQPYVSKSIPKPKYMDESGRSYFEQDGREVYKRVRGGVPDLIREAVLDAELEADDIRVVIPHQGSIHIVDALKKQLGEFEVYENMEDGNFSSASTFKALQEQIESHNVQRGDKVVLAGFGAGLYASVVVIQLGEK